MPSPSHDFMVMVGQPAFRAVATGDDEDGNGLSARAHDIVEHHWNGASLDLAGGCRPPLRRALAKGCHGASSPTAPATLRSEEEAGCNAPAPGLEGVFPRGAAAMRLNAALA